MSITEAEAAKHEGMRRSYQAANPEWVVLMATLVRETCQVQAQFTADDIFARYDAIRGAPVTGDNRAFGPIMKQAATLGYCRRTNTVARSTRREVHNHPLAIWESLICEAPK